MKPYYNFYDHDGTLLANFRRPFWHRGHKLWKIRPTAHDPPESVPTIAQNHRPRSFRMTAHDGPEYAAMMNEQAIKQAEALLKDAESYPFVGDVIDQIGIGRTTFYRYFPPDWNKGLRNEHSPEADLSQSL